MQMQMMSHILAAGCRDGDRRQLRLEYSARCRPRAWRVQQLAVRQARTAATGQLSRIYAQRETRFSKAMHGRETELSRLERGRRAVIKGLVRAAAGTATGSGWQPEVRRARVDADCEALLGRAHSKLPIVLHKYRTR